MNAHVELDLLGALADGTLPRDEAATVREHLAACRSCTAAYADAVRYRLAWLADSKAFGLDREYQDLVPSLDEAEQALRPQKRGGSHPIWRHSAAAALIVATILIVVRLWPRESPLTFALPPAVREATERASVRGLVLPGAELGAVLSYPEMRSGSPGVSLKLQREVQDLVHVYERGPRSARSCAQVVAGLLATGETDAANAYAREGLREHPRSVVLLVYAADTRYRANDLDAAEALLRRATAQAPGDPLVALDLALVLKQTGRVDEARVLLVRAADASAPGVVARARRELAELR